MSKETSTCAFTGDPADRVKTYTAAVEADIQKVHKSCGLSPDDGVGFCRVRRTFLLIYRKPFGENNWNIFQRLDFFLDFLFEQTLIEIPEYRNRCLRTNFKR